MGNAEVSVRELRNHGGEVLDRVVAGEQVIVTRSGRPVAVLRPLRGPGLKASVLMERWARLPRIDPQRLRDDVDQIIDRSL